MVRRVVSTLIGTALCLMVIPIAAGNESPKPDLIELKRIPGASTLGWVEVVRPLEADGVGWHCDNSFHLDSHFRLQEGRARIPPDIANRGVQAIYDYQLRHGRRAAFDATTWTSAMGTFLRNSLAILSEQRPEYRMPKPSLTWRGWLRQTLEDIHEKADRNGMSSTAKKKALQNWVLCHVSESHAERVRQLLYDSLGDRDKR